MVVYQTQGGDWNQVAMSSGVAIGNPVAGQWTAPDIGNLKAMTGYTAVVVANGTDGKTYNAPVKSAVTNPP